MFKVLALTCVFLALSSVHTQDCTTTQPLRTLYGFGNTVTTPTAASGANFCKSIKSGNVCCTAGEINSISDKSAAIVKNLTSMVATRDTYLKLVKDTIIPSIVSSLNGLLPIVTQFETYVQTYNLSSQAGFDDLMSGLDYLLDVSGYLIANLTAIKSDYVSYQKSRTSCIVEMIDLQNAAYCLSCDPNAGTKGYTYTFGYNFLDISTTVCTRLKSQCTAYISGAAGQNVLIDASYGASIINVLGAALQGLMTGNMAAFSAFDAASNDPSATPKSAIVSTASIPDGCDGGSCDWICDSLFTNGQINQLALALGGEPDSSRRLLANSNKRQLSGSWNPDRDESGVTVTFQDDPAGTNNPPKSASIVGNVFVSMMVVMSAVLLF